MKKISTKKGYTLLFAALTAVLVLGVAVFILGVARKQYILSSTARDSMAAIYNADAGVECAVQALSQAGGTIIDGSGISILCGNSVQYSVTFGGPHDNNSSVPGYFDQGGADNYIFDQSQPIYRGPAGEGDTNQRFIPLTIGSTNIGCVILKFWSGTSKNNNGLNVTVVNSRGYNLCDNTGHPINSPRTVERAMQFTVQ